MIFDDPLITEGIVCLGLEIVLTPEQINALHEFQHGVKHDQDKPRMDLLDPEALEGVARVLSFGARKYAEHNWRKGLAISRLLGAALRHIFAHLRGEDLDPESGLMHLDHAACCLMFAQWTARNRPELDDRWKHEAR